jgi:hypothetical protein
MRLHTTDLLTEGLKDALSAAGLPAVGDVFWEVPRDERHGDYATNVAMTLARPLGSPRARSPRPSSPTSAEPPWTPRMPAPGSSTCS